MRVHAQESRKVHFSVESVQCPQCQAAIGHDCIVNERTGQRLPMNTVHASRVRAMGHNVRVI